jgi:signal transduction histidine kinase
MLVLLACSLLGTGYVAFRYTQSQEEIYNLQRLERKEGAVERSMDWVLQQREGELNDQSVNELFSDKICELSDVHDVDISLYSPEGLLWISSVPGKPSDSTARMEVPLVVLSSLAAGSSREEGEDLDLGKYVQAYWNHFDSEGNVAMVVNVRYEKRPLDGGGFWIFFNQLAPVYGVLFLATSALGLLLTRAIVGPLRALRDSMNQLDLKSPVPLSYPQNDAIGELVSEYNRLQQELSTKLEELTRKEREGAWRTMAVQVAHEVKNPLTPLMLGVQQLEKAYRDNHPDFPVRIRRFAQMAQTQIESLSQIAEDFRNLSQWDELPVKRTDLLAVLRSATDLFVLGQPGIQWSFEIPEEEIWVWASPTHLTRVFNNLINNALDAIRETHDGRMGEVSIVIRPEKDSCRVILQDNGVGISIENMQRIFDPQFTTKAQGSGLGLAMVKAIMEQFGGSIDVESDGLNGARFTLTLRRAH